MTVETTPTEAWPDAVLERVKTLWGEGYSAGYISSQVGKTRNAVISKLHRMGLMRGGSSRVYDPGNRKKRIAVVSPARVTGRAPLPKPEVYVEPPLAVIPDNLVKMVDLEAHHCRWPIGDPRSPQFGFCGARKGPVGSYCDTHFAESRQDLPAVKSGQFVLYAQRRRRVG